MVGAGGAGRGGARSPWERGGRAGPAAPGRDPRPSRPFPCPRPGLRNWIASPFLRTPSLFRERPGRGEAALHLPPSPREGCARGGSGTGIPMAGRDRERENVQSTWQVPEASPRKGRGRQSPPGLSPCSRHPGSSGRRSRSRAVTATGREKRNRERKWDRAVKREPGREKGPGGQKETRERKGN